MCDRWTPLRQLLEDGLKHGVYTAAVALVGLKGQCLWEAAVGRVSGEPQAEAVTPETVFDLASLTKPLATAVALMRLVDQGKLTLTTTLGDLLPEEWLPPDKAPLTIESLLAHRAGLPAWRPFYQEVLQTPRSRRPGMLARLAAATPLEHPPDTATLYSDLGFMLLQAVVETSSGASLDKFCQESIYRPLGLGTLGFRALLGRGDAGSATENRKPKTENHIYAATETGLIPGRRIFGEVHDENAWAAGGVAGHSGLFGRGREVLALAAALYRAFHREAATLPWRPATVRRFLTPPPGSPRALGFDTPTPGAGQSSTGRYFSPGSVGHLGFTGTSFWLDLELGQMVVLLTNRVHLGRDNLDGIKAFRPRFHEAASKALGVTTAFRP
jgi:CubicO group peptidase (beta-lactamase class C family)